MPPTSAPVATAKPTIARPSRWRPAIWARRSKFGCATTAPVSRAKSGTGCFSRSLPPSRPAKVPVSASRSAGTSSPSSMAARSRSTAVRASSPNSRSACRVPGRHNDREDGMTFSILVVEDEPDVAEMFRQRFRREARQGTYVLHFAASGEEALDMLANGVRPELIVILSDINMPGMDGTYLTLLRIGLKHFAECAEEELEMLHDTQDELDQWFE